MSNKTRLLLWHHHNGWVAPDMYVLVEALKSIILWSYMLPLNLKGSKWTASACDFVHMWLSLSLSDLVITLRVIIITWSLSWYAPCQCVALVKSKSTQSIIREMRWKHFQVPWLDIKDWIWLEFSQWTVIKSWSLLNISYQLWPCLGFLRCQARLLHR